MKMLSIVVLNYNGIKHLDSCFESIEQQENRDYETILVDNGSTDGSITHIRKRFPWVRIVDLQRNLGFSSGMNAGIREAKGEAVFLLNNDIVLERNCTEAIEHALKEQRSYLFFAPKMLNLRDKSIIDSGGIVFRDYKSSDRGQGQKDDALFSKEEEVFGACGGAVVFRKEFFEKVGYFDEDFFIYHEDVDLSLRAQLKGEKCLFLPAAKVYHYRGATNILYSNIHVFLSGKNGLNYQIKNLPIRLFVKNLRRLFLHHKNEILYFAKRGQGLIILKSKIAAFLQLPKMLRKRWKIQNSMTISIEEVDMILRGDDIYEKTG
jgi:GT2 family glycosyltransferase